MGDLERSIQYFGESLKGAFLEPAATELKVAETIRGLNEQEDLKQKRAKAADLLGKKYGPEAKSLYEAGEGLSAITGMKNLDYRRSGRGGGSGGGRGGGKQDWLTKVNAANLAMQGINDQLAQANQNYADAIKNGDENQILNSAKNLDAITKSADQIKVFISSLSSAGKKDYVEQMSQKFDDTMTSIPTAQQLLVDEAVQKSMRDRDEIEGDVLDYLDELNIPGLKTNGVVNQNDLDNMSLYFLSQSNPSAGGAENLIKKINGIKTSVDTGFLQTIIADEDAPMEDRALAAMRYKYISTFENMVPGGKEYLQGLSDKDLETLSESDGQSVFEKRTIQAAKKEQIDREEYKEKSGLSIVEEIDQLKSEIKDLENTSPIASLSVKNAIRSNKRKIKQLEKSLTQEQKKNIKQGSW